MSYLVSLAEALADAEVFTDGDWVESKDQDPDGDVRLTQLADVGDGSWIDKSARFLTSEKAKELRCTYLKSGDLLVARMPDPLGRCCVFPGDPMPCVTVVDVCVVRPNQRRIDNRYLMHVINSPHGRRGITKHITGTTRQRISRKNLGKVQIPLPPLAEQKRIAKILDAADALRAKRRESLAQLDTLLQSTFLDMFGDPVTNPMGWEIRALGDLADNEDGKRVPVKKADRERAAGTFPYYGASGVIDYVDNYLFDGERLLIGEDGANLVARSTPIAFIAKGKYWVNNHAHVLAFNGRAELMFLEAIINSIDLKPYLSGTAQPKLNQKSLNRIPIPTPPIDLQHRFSAIVESVERQRIRLRTHLDELDTLFASLQSRAFNGEL